MWLGWLGWKFIGSTQMLRKKRPGGPPSVPRASEEGSCPPAPRSPPWVLPMAGSLPSPQLRLLSSFWVKHALQPTERGYIILLLHREKPPCIVGAPWSVLHSNEEINPQSRLTVFFHSSPSLSLWSELGKSCLGFRHEVTTSSVQTEGAFEDFISKLWFF